MDHGPSDQCITAHIRGYGRLAIAVNPPEVIRTGDTIPFPVIVMGREVCYESQNIMLYLESESGLDANHLLITTTPDGKAVQREKSMDADGDYIGYYETHVAFHGLGISAAGKYRFCFRMSDKWISRNPNADSTIRTSIVEVSDHGPEHMIPRETADIKSEWPLETEDYRRPCVGTREKQRLLALYKVGSVILKPWTPAALERGGK
ncbi:hypothetical protein F4778DRAFT_724118 [Xylariomycetidae sp. FL2044]|nr:hypothetical protein F4778DRAFT_724118 [Xylariomycetidae sp. FL2044]